MTTEPAATSPSQLPDFIQAAKPNPLTNRAAWYLTIAPTYAGIFLWFAFWDETPFHGKLNVSGLEIALLGVILAGVICHFLFYLIPGLLGQKTGLPLYIVGTSTYGAIGGLIMPGFLMGLLQFGWLGVNTYLAAKALAGANDTILFYVLCVIWGSGAAFVGLKGIQYVAKVATFLPIIPLAVLLLGLGKFGGSAMNYVPPDSGHEGSTGVLLALLAMISHIVGFFATAGAAGVDIAMSGRDRKDVSLGGLVGILLATVITAGFALVIVAGGQAQGLTAGSTKDALTATENLKVVFPGLYPAIMIGLALAAFPGACFSSFIAANSFKTVMPRVNPYLSVGLGALVSIILAVTTVAGKLDVVFLIIGASFGPICGAMVVDYFMAGKRWPGPRAGFNLAGWISWALGFIVGIMPILHNLNKAVSESSPDLAKLLQSIPDVPAAPVVAFVVGAVVYFVLAKAGLQGPVVPYQYADQQSA